MQALVHAPDRKETINNWAKLAQLHVKLAERVKEELDRAAGQEGASDSADLEDMLKTLQDQVLGPDPFAEIAIVCSASPPLSLSLSLSPYL
jgi:hypothetical protein